MNEREHWLSVKATDEDIRAHIADPNISLDKTLKAITVAFPDHPKSIAEIGCGYGRLTVEIKKMYPKAFVAGIDVNPDLLKKAEEYSGYTKDKSNPSAYPFFYCRDNLNGIAAQDAIYSVAVFQHLPTEEKRAYIEQAYKVLRKGGVLRVQFVEGHFDGFVNHTCSMNEMMVWFEAAGFKIANIAGGFVHQDWSWITGVKQ